MKVSGEGSEMAYYPPGQFLKEFARRTLANFKNVQCKKPLDWGDTALICFLLGVFVVPHERIEEEAFLEGVLSDYEVELKEVMTIIGHDKLADKGFIEPKAVSDLPELLRHSVSHFNIRLISKNEKDLTHLLVWNVNPRKKNLVTFVAEIDIEKLRHLAEHVLRRLSQREYAYKYDNYDPVKLFEEKKPAPKRKARAQNTSHSV